MIGSIIPLVTSFLPLWQAYLVPVLLLSFVAWVGTLLHSFLRR